MAWINGQWVEDRPAFGGMLGGLRPEEELIYGGTFDAPGSMGDWNPPPLPPTPPTWTQGPPFMPGPQPDVGRGGGVGDPTPQNPFQQPIYGQGPQMQTPFGGGLGNIDQWNPAQPGIGAQYQPPQMMPPLDIPGRMPVPPVPPQVRPPMPPPPPTIGDVWPQPDPPQVRPPFPPITGWEPGGDVVPPPIPTLPPGPKTDHEFNVMQRERTKLRLAQDRAKTKKHYAKLRAKGASPQTIAKAKAKSKARSKKIKGQSLRRRTIKN